MVGLARRRREVGGRPNKVQVALSDEESLAISAAATAAGLTVPSYLVTRAIAPPDRPEGAWTLAERRAIAAELIGQTRELRGMAANLNQIAHHANAIQELSEDHTAAIEETRRLLKETRAVIRRLDPREPA